MESGLEFTFPESWIVRKFDATPAYRSLSGQGLKGVDFLCLPPGEELWLIEVKNYDTVQGPRKSPVELARHVAAKFADTQRLIRIMRKAMERNWWYRWKLHYYRWTGSPDRSSHSGFWTEADRRLSSMGAVCLLWLQLPVGVDTDELVDESELESLLTPSDRLHVVNQHAGRPVPGGIRVNTKKI